MAKEKNPDRIRMFTPPGVLKWPKLTKVDHGTDKFPNPAGSYNTKAVYDRSAPKVGTFLDKLDDLMGRAKELAEEKFAELPVAARKKLEAKGGISAVQPYSAVYDEETEEDTGKVEIKFAMKASGERKDGSKWQAKPDLFDGRNKPLPKGVEIWGGSVAVINADFEPYFVAGTGEYGVSRRLNAVQIKELVAGGQRNASAYGFEADEDGFDSSSYQASEDEDEGASNSGSEGGTSDDDCDF